MPRQPGSVLPYGHHREPAGLDQRTTLKRVSPHRLRALVLEDLERYPNSGRTEIHRRIGTEIGAKSVTRALNDLMRDGAVLANGERRWRTYRLVRGQGQSL